MQDDRTVQVGDKAALSNERRGRRGGAMLAGMARPQGRGIRNHNIFGLIVETASNFLPATGCILSLHDLTTHAARAVASSGLSPELAGRVINALARRHAGTSAAELRGGSVARQLPILHGTLIEDRDRRWVLSVVRDAGPGSFTRADVQTLMKLRGLFRAALEQHIQSMSLYPACWAIVEQHSSGIALLHKDGSIAAANKSALLLLQGGKRGLAIINNRLCCPDAGNSLRLRQALEEVRYTRSGHGRAFMIEGPKGGSLLQVNLVRLGDDESSHKDVSIAAFITDPDFFAGPSIEHLQTLYNLTRVEAEVVQLICRGCSPAQAAQRLRISVHTVRSYLKAIFSKIGVNRQADIVRLVANSPALIQTPN
jgi:DNA-binding CsgD family transcriptional regulator